MTEHLDPVATLRVLYERLLSETPDDPALPGMLADLERMERGAEIIPIHPELPPGTPMDTVGTIETESQDTE